MGAGSDGDKNGIIQMHAYTILDVQEVEGHKLLKIRNPHGHGEWTGAWSDASAEWGNNPNVATAVRKGIDGAADDGIFWMSYEDFGSHFGPEKGT